MHDDGFRRGLLARIERYREAEASAGRRLSEVERELDRARERRRAAEALYQAEFGGVQLPLQQTESDSRMERARSPRSQAGPLAGASWDAAIERVLREAGEPLHVNNIWQRLEQGGFITRAADPKRSVAAIAVRNPRMARSAANTYTLVPRPKEGDMI